ncbi:9758_t:CDS:1, partial [Cetraspora pellucida]
VYSFGIIMWMFSSGTLPFCTRKYDEYLALDIYNGARTQIIDGTPSCFINLMQRCWNIEPEKRPISSEIYDIICSWYYLNNYKEFKAADDILLSKYVQDIEFPVIQNATNSLHLNDQNNSYHSCRIDLKLISTTSLFQ